MDLVLERLDDARTVIDPVFLDTPQFEDGALSSALDRRVVVKLETGNPIHCFKGRGVGYAMRDAPRGSTVVCASSGNFGQAVAFTGRARGVRTRVFTTTTANPSKCERMRRLGTEVVRVGASLADARESAVRAADRPGTRLLTDGDDPAIAEGAGTIAQELGRAGTLDAVVVPVGDGSLISGIGLWMRAHAPDTAVIGVNSAAAPAMRESLIAGHPVDVPVEAAPLAEGISVPRPHERALARVSDLVDDIVTVSDEALLDAMALAARSLSVVLEPAGAAAIAAVAADGVPGERVAVICTGANPASTTLRRLAGRLA